MVTYTSYLWRNGKKRPVQATFKQGPLEWHSSYLPLLLVIPLTSDANRMNPA